MDPEVEPCDDFYDFACGGFLKSTIIPDDKTSVNTFTEISDELQNQLRTSIEEKSTPDEPKPFRLAKNLYKACMNKSECLFIYVNVDCFVSFYLLYTLLPLFQRSSSNKDWILC